MVVELRYQGNRALNPWTTENWNSLNQYETGLLGESRLGLPAGEYERAQQNLRANVLAGLGPTFAYTGIPGTSPLPIYYAHLEGPGNPNVPSLPGVGNYNGALWTNATFTNQLDPFFPNPGGAASTLYLSTSTLATAAGAPSTRFFTNAAAAGYPSNFWTLNPLVNTVAVMTNSRAVRNNHFWIVELRRRLSGGLAVQGSYTYARSWNESQQDFHFSPSAFNLRQTGVPHAFRALWTYDLPVGRGKRFGANMNAWLDGVLGGWAVSGTARVQTQAFVLRDAVLVGMSHDEAREAMRQLRYGTDPVSAAWTVWTYPGDSYTNTRVAYDTVPTRPTFSVPGTEPTGRYFAPAGGPNCNWIYPGDCGTTELWFRGRWFGEFDFRFAKQFNLPGRARFELSAEVFNALMAKNFPSGVSPGTGANTFRITSTQSNARTAQVVWRVTW
jgi:hypothetical protein